MNVSEQDNGQDESSLLPMLGGRHRRYGLRFLTDLSKCARLPGHAKDDHTMPRRPDISLRLRDFSDESMRRKDCWT